MDMKLHESRAVVTGASGNLGGAVLRELHARGARVLGIASGPESLPGLQQAAGALGERAFAAAADLTTEAGASALAAAVEEHLGGVDILVNAAGGYQGGAMLWEVEPSDWDHMLQINLQTVFLCCRALVPGMVGRGYGRVVNIASRAAEHPQKGAGAYSVAKSAVVAYTRALREEVKGSGVTAVALAPSVIDSPDMRRSMPKADFARWVTAEELAQAVAYLVSEEGGLFSGGLLPAYGGL